MANFFLSILDFDNIHYVQEDIGERGLSFTLYDPAYGGEKFSPAIMGNGTLHKYPPVLRRHLPLRTPELRQDSPRHQLLRQQGRRRLRHDGPAAGQLRKEHDLLSHRRGAGERGRPAYRHLPRRLARAQPRLPGALYGRLYERQPRKGLRLAHILLLHRQHHRLGARVHRGPPARHTDGEEEGHLGRPLRQRLRRYHNGRARPRLYAHAQGHRQQAGAADDVLAGQPDLDHVHNAHRLLRHRRHSRRDEVDAALYGRPDELRLRKVRPERGPERARDIHAAHLSRTPPYP